MKKMIEIFFGKAKEISEKEMAWIKYQKEARSQLMLLKNRGLGLAVSTY